MLFRGLLLLGSVFYSLRILSAWRYVSIPSILPRQDVLASMKQSHSVKSFQLSAFWKDNLYFPTADYQELQSFFETHKCTTTNRLNYSEMQEFPEYQLLDRFGLIDDETAKSYWKSIDVNEQGLDLDDVYEFLTLLIEVPERQELLTYQRIFKVLIKKFKRKPLVSVSSSNSDTDKEGIGPIRGELTFEQLLTWSDIRHMLVRQHITMAQLQQFWNETCHSKTYQKDSEINHTSNKTITQEQFVKLNKLIDSFIEESHVNPTQTGSLTMAVPRKNALANCTSSDVWSREFPLDKVFPEKVLLIIKHFYLRNKDNHGRISWSDFLEWSAVQSLLEDQAIVLEELQEVWKIAAAEFDGEFVNYDKYLRINAWIELKMKKPQVTTNANAAVDDKYKAFW